MSWEFGSCEYSRDQDGQGAWLAAPHSFLAPVVLPNGLELRIRTGFTVVNGSGPIPTGELRLERLDPVAGWTSWQNWYAKNVKPTHYEEDPEDPGGGVGFPGTVVEFYPTLFPAHFPAGDPVRTRIRVDWTGGPYYSPEIEYTTQAVLDSVSGSLDEFFETADFGRVATVDGVDLVRVIFEDPFVRPLQVTGRAPVALIETALLKARGYTRGTSFEVAGRSFTVRALAEHADGTTSAALEEVA